MFESGLVPQDGDDAEIGATLAALADDVLPGPAAVAILARIDPRTLTGAQQVDLLKAWDRHNAWAAAQQCNVLAAMDHPSDVPSRPGRDASSGLPELVPGLGASEWTELEVAAALRLSPGAAQRRLDMARELCGRLPGTWATLAEGRIGFLHALTITETTMPLDAPAAVAVEARVLPKAVRQSVGQLRRTLSRAVLAADPAAAQAAHERAVADRTVNFCPLPEGIAGLWMVGPAAEVNAVYTALTGLADRPRHPDDTRLAGARRFDGLYEVCAGLLAGGDLPTRHGQRPHIQVTVAASTLLGLDDQPAELAGYGPITAAVARRVAADGTWRRILFDPADGKLLNYGRTTYQPPADLRRHVIARDQTCTFPQCTRPAQRCDIDHAVPWDEGGHTDPDNCHPLCRRHHRAKTHAGWHVERTPNGTSIWTSPTGHTYTVHPTTYCNDPPHGGHPPDHINPPHPDNRWGDDDPPDHSGGAGDDDQQSQDRDDPD